jgi:alcohol dehydrogenase class IV
MILPTPMLLPVRTITGEGSLLQLAQECAGFGNAGVIVHGSAFSGACRDGVLAAFPKEISVAAYRHRGGEPTLDEVEALRSYLRDRHPAWVVAIGGGSVIDLAKAAAGLLGAPARVAAYQQGLDIPPATTPFIAVPTTAGTGSEATVVAVLTDSSCNLKQSIRHVSFMPRTVILDPTLLQDCPRPTIASAGMDALTQAYESWVSRYATDFTRDLSSRALRAIVKALPAVYAGDHSAARDLLEGSYLAGLALSHARLGIVHGLAHPLGARGHLAHGLVCACCLPVALQFNAACTVGQMQAINQAIGCDFAEWVDRSFSTFAIPSPFKGTEVQDREGIIAETLKSGSTKANPRTVTASDVDQLLNTLYCK